MSTTEPVLVAPVPASIDNAADWEVLSHQIAVGTAMPPAATPEMMVAMIGSAVPLLYAADQSRNPNVLRGTFADPIVAQCALNIGNLMGARPASVIVHLVGSRAVGGHPVVRVHLSIQHEEGGGGRGTDTQFWDLQLGAQVTVGQPNCPKCGAPMASGELVCSHCHTDVRDVVDVPIVVSRLELY